MRPRKRSETDGVLPLPQGWDTHLDYDGKVVYVDHSTQQTSWINPLDRFTKPASFADCVGNELPYGWDEIHDPQLGTYFINHLSQTTQIEDPRKQWREQQEQMLREYLEHANEDLCAKKEIYDVKQERLVLAQEEVQTLKDRLHLKASRTSLNSAVSTTSVSSTASKVDPDLLRADVAHSKDRVARIKREIAQIQAEMSYVERGVETLTQVDNQQHCFTADEAQEICSKIRENQRSIHRSEQEKLELIRSLARLKEEVLAPRLPTGSSPDVSTLSLPSLPQEKMDTESQTDLSGDVPMHENHWGEVVRMRLQYEEARQQVKSLSEQLANVDGRMIPGQAESDKDRLLLIQEKEQLLRELRSINPKGHTEAEMENTRLRIQQLEQDLQDARELSNKQIAERLKLNDNKSNIFKRLVEATKLTTYLESQLKSLSLSTLSVSSGSSRGSLGSLSASSKGSLNSLSISDIYSSTSGLPQSDINLQDLHRRVEKLLQGHSGISTIQEDVVMTSSSTSQHDVTSSSSSSSQPDLTSSQHDVTSPPHDTYPETVACGVTGGQGGYSAPPPPSYEQHMRQAARPAPSLPDPSPTGNPPRRALAPGDTDNPPLSPISESSSGVCNNSGMNTRSVSAAVSDVSVAGDSGVYEASIKKPGELDDVFDMGLECAQIQIKLKYEKEDSALQIGVEQARNLSALAFPSGPQCQVCIKAALLPCTDAVPLQTPTAKDLNNPQFHQIFRVPIEESRLPSRTLQFHVWCVTDKNIEECLGSAQVSLASFDSTKVLTQWYNVLSFKFMQSDSGHHHANSSSNSMNSSRSSLLGHQLSASVSNPAPGDKVKTLLEDTSVRLKKNSSGVEKLAPESHETRLRSLSVDGASYRPITSVSSITSVKEESSMSSDESTIISSQTSTLTRNQGPEDMQHGPLDNAEGSSEDDMESQYDEEDDVTEEEELSPGGTIRVVTCDKETNTDPNFRRSSHVKRRAPGEVSSIKRSQTFSPVGRQTQDDYICRLNRSDSDSSVKYRHGRRHFQRNATERRSIRHKRPQQDVDKSQTLYNGRRNKMRTSLDLELDLRASQVRLHQLNDEVTRLKHLRQRFEEAKRRGETEPAWLANNEQLQTFLNQTDKLAKKHERSASVLDEKASSLLKKATKNAQRRAQSAELNARTFRGKMAFFTTVTMGVPAISAENQSQTTAASSRADDTKLGTASQSVPVVGANLSVPRIPTIHAAVVSDPSHNTLLSATTTSASHGPSLKK